MEKKLRSLLIRVLGFEHYLTLVSYVYLKLIQAGFLKKKYPELFYLEQIIKPGFVCIDIGANVGYYSVFLSKYAGANGHVHAVEPVALFTDVFRKNTEQFAHRNITLHHTALGAQNGSVTMGTPLIDGVLRHGLTHVLASDEDATNMHTYQVPLQVPDELFSSLTRLDFVKCDVEGYEVFLFPYFLQTLIRFKPTIQIEITGEQNIQRMLEILMPLGYQPHALTENQLRKLSTQEALSNKSDFYFTPA